MTMAALLMLAACSAGLLVFASWRLLRVSDRDARMAARLAATRGQWTHVEPAPRRTASHALVQRWLAGLGGAVLRSGLLASGTREELQNMLAAAGFRGRNALQGFIGIKIVLACALPAATWWGAQLLHYQPSTRMVATVVAFIIGLLGPDRAVRTIRQRYLDRLEGGLPDALDLLVICAQAGLSLAPAIARVAAELRVPRPEVAKELETTVRELEIMSSAQVALGNLAKRTGLPTLERLVSTLVQTMQYGTPLTDALRSLSAEVRQQALIRFEARAARLPVLLTLPMIAFILPCVFIIAGGPAVLRIMAAFHHH